MKIEFLGYEYEISEELNDICKKFKDIQLEVNKRDKKIKDEWINLADKIIENKILENVIPAGTNVFYCKKEPTPYENKINNDKHYLKFDRRK